MKRPQHRAVDFNPKIKFGAFAVADVGWLALG
jgi:hypothetical protein